MTTHFSGPVESTNGFVGALVGGVSGPLSTGAPQQVASADGAIAPKSGLVVITKGSAAVLTLAAPTAGVDDGKILEILSTTAFAHTVTQTAPGFNNGGAASDVGTYGAAVGNNMSLRAYNGIWYVMSVIGVTFA